MNYFELGFAALLGFAGAMILWETAKFSRDSDGTATAAINEDLSVPQDCQARAGTASPIPDGDAA